METERSANLRGNQASVDLEEAKEANVVKEAKEASAVKEANAVKEAKGGSEVEGASLGITPSHHQRTMFPIICSIFSSVVPRIIV